MTTWQRARLGHAAVADAAGNVSGQLARANADRCVGQRHRAQRDAGSTGQNESHEFDVQ